MRDLLIWPNGDWAYRDEVWRPDPGFATARIPEYWPDSRVDKYVQDFLENQDEGRSSHRERW